MTPSKGRRILIWSCLLVLILLWGAWFFFAQVPVVEVSDQARIEVIYANHPIEASTDGKIVESRLQLDGRIHAGSLLVRLDAKSEELELAETKTRLDTLGQELVSVQREFQSALKAQKALIRAGKHEEDEIKKKLEGTEVITEFSERKADRVQQLLEDDAISAEEVDRIAAEAKSNRSELQSLRHSLDRLTWQKRSEALEQQVRLNKLAHDETSLAGEMKALHARIKRLEYEIERRHIRSPIDGRIVEVPDLPIGSVVHSGDRLGAVLPDGQLRIVAMFEPASALGRIKKGQKGQLRLDGFPWTQYGTVKGVVTGVAGEVTKGSVRVELSLTEEQSASIPKQHGLPGQLEIEIERVSPATLVLRAAGRLVTYQPPSPSGPPGSQS